MCVTSIYTNPRSAAADSLSLSLLVSDGYIYKNNVIFQYFQILDQFPFNPRFSPYFRIYMLDFASASSTWRRGRPPGQPCALCWQINSNDDRGVLVGQWHDYSNGVHPCTWIGSADILRQWKESGPVRYGQCWVFAAVACTGWSCCKSLLLLHHQAACRCSSSIWFGLNLDSDIRTHLVHLMLYMMMTLWWQMLSKAWAGLLTCVSPPVSRALGIPCRVVTNFESAHDSDANLIIENLYTEKGENISDCDSIWWGHRLLKLDLRGCWQNTPQLWRI